MQKENVEQASTGRILIMDDEPMIRELVEKLLQAKGFEVVSAEDGKEAIALYMQSVTEGKPFDVVIMDLTIPGGMGGGEAVKELLEIDSGVKAVVTSGYASNDVMSNYRDYGFVDYMAKPFTLESMMDVIGRHC